MGRRPKNYDRMYNALNDLILFGGNACNNAHSLEVKIIKDLNIPLLKLAYPTIKDLNIPLLKLAYPTNQNQIISLIDKTNYFLRNLENSHKNINSDDLTVDLMPKQDKYPYFDIKKILNNLI